MEFSGSDEFGLTRENLDITIPDIDNDEQGCVSTQRKIPTSYKEYLAELEKPLKQISERAISSPPGIKMGRHSRLSGDLHRPVSPGIDIDWSKWEFCLEPEKYPTPDDPGPKIILRPRSPSRRKMKNQRRYLRLVDSDTSTSAVTSMSRAETPKSEEPKFVPVEKLKVVSSETQTEYPYPEPIPAFYPGNMTTPIPVRSGSPVNKYNNIPHDYYQYVVPQNGYSADNRMLFRKQVEAPKIRCGRVGSSWRHVKQCLGNLGNQIMFIDGAVKTEDIDKFPPWGFHTQPKRPDSRQQVFYEPPTMYNTMNGLPRQRPMHHNGLNTEYNQRAKKGYKYWYEEKKPSRLESLKRSKGSRQSNRTT
ncbi:uncharacterized protein LOC141914446 isoform X2 [Tubulanus polymorphus]|uniref:uncharacterized protein LOC141914446 isoform X2 n=1 Tax=Tubulanus polymorphus TaxID=672921 RepID=UPI003DA3233A